MHDSYQCGTENDTEITNLNFCGCAVEMCRTNYILKHACKTSKIVSLLYVEEYPVVVQRKHGVIMSCHSQAISAL